jgi:hypothetical protein
MPIRRDFNPSEYASRKSRKRHNLRTVLGGHVATNST